MNERGCLTDARVIIGGKGRPDETAADRFALLAIQASEQFREPLPQLTLRFYDEQNPALLQAAYDNFERGWIYPMLYRDEINIPAVMRAFCLDAETAAQFVPFGCGEYVIDHQSLGTPSGVINLLKALEVTLFHGYDLTLGKQMAPDIPYHSFEDLLQAYRRNVERYVDALALQEKIEYEVAAETAPHLFLSLLYDDCIDKGKPLLSGGVRYLGGTLESYGNANTADSLTAIERLVYREKRFSIEQLLEMLRQNFEGFESERSLLLQCPKYGNDDDTADSMLIRIHEHLCRYTMSRAERVGLDSYLIVIINNSANTTFGRYTGASADGRLAGEPMANGNNPAGGRGQSGVTAFLNSIVKPDNTIHAGAVQNMKFSQEMFTRYRKQTELLLSVYFQKGQQAMLNILSQKDLEDAMARPWLYPHLIVRVGGFSARFIELSGRCRKKSYRGRCMGMIFDIQRCSLNDGPGIRTTFFLKGCPLRCVWCHNPESWSASAQLSFDAQKCVLCRRCMVCLNGVHQFDETHTVAYTQCTACGRCVSACPAGALRIYGQVVTAQALIDIARRDPPLLSGVRRRHYGIRRGAAVSAGVHAGDSQNGA